MPVTRGGRNRHKSGGILIRLKDRYSKNLGKRMQFETRAQAETWLQAHGVKLTDRILGRQVGEAFSPVGLRVLAAIDYIGGLIAYTHRDHRIKDWQTPPRRAFLRSAA